MRLFKSAASPPFVPENARLRDMARSLAPIDRAEPFQPLAEGVWISSEEDAGADLAVSGGAQGLVLDLKTIGRSNWLSLSYAVPVAALREGRFIAFIIQTRSSGFVSYRPCLRYLLTGDGFEDTFCRDYLVSAGGEDEQVSFIRIDPEKLARSTGVEVHLFFQGTRFRVELPLIETVLIR